MAPITPLHPAAADGLALAMVAASSVPLLLLDGALTVIAASAMFCRTFDLDPERVTGRPLAEIGAGEWGGRRLQSLLKTTAARHTDIDAYELDLERFDREVRNLVVNARKLDYADAANVRLLLTVTDVTDARAAARLKDDLLREKAVLLQELQHRVANSLQIIASVILQSARRSQSDETRNHLYDAHNRVMSVAAVQQQLAATRLGDVELRPYLISLCDSLGASMIHDPEQLQLQVNVDDSVTSADVSVSLGLIVTELVINALKHAFPGHRRGRILVDYGSYGTNWTLTVADDGVGMPADAASAKPGLGTSIVEALANQLEAQVLITGANPGTLVAVAHA